MLEHELQQNYDLPPVPGTMVHQDLYEPWHDPFRPGITEIVYDMMPGKPKQYDITKPPKDNKYKPYDDSKDSKVGKAIATIVSKKYRDSKKNKI